MIFLIKDYSAICRTYKPVKCDYLGEYSPEKECL